MTSCQRIIWFFAGVPLVLALLIVLAERARSQELPARCTEPKSWSDEDWPECVSVIKRARAASGNRTDREGADGTEY